MYELSRFVKNLNFVDMFNIQNCANSMGNCVHQMYGLSRFVKNLNFVDMFKIQNCANSMGNCVH